MKKYNYEYFASSPSGLEELLAKELADLGAKTTVVVRGGVQFEGSHDVALKAILFSRIASRVFKFLHQFDVNNEQDYYLAATDIKWKSLMDLEHTFRITTIFGDLPFERDEFRNSQFANLKLKDAIVDYFRHHEGVRPSVEKDSPDVSFLARIDRGDEKPYKATIMYDLCGDPLNQRGYRVSKTEAPVKENVAAGIIQLVKWDPENEDFIDGMCGSGTFVIEAALMAAGIAPSYLRVEWHLKNPSQNKPWTFLNYQWLTKDQELLKEFKELLKEISGSTAKGLEKLAGMKGKIAGNDLSEMSLISARENLREAKLDKVIALTQVDARVLNPNQNKTLFICNPPYGERLEHGEEEKLKDLYKGLGDHWKHNFKGHRAALFTGNLQMLKSVGLKSSKKHMLYNGDIDCRVAEYNLY
jgi:23S rRNA G2445 N2-methylase RlmL